MPAARFLMVSAEMDVANFTPLPSKKVKPAGIKECISNMEARVIDQVEVSNTTIFVVEIVGMSVDKEALDRDRHSKIPAGYWWNRPRI